MNLLLFYALTFVAMGLVIWFFSRRRQVKRKPAKTDAHTRQERAVWAWAKVITSSLGTIDLSGQARVALRLEVHMPGTPAYLANTTWIVQQEGLAYIESGREVSLKVDPLDPQYVFPNGPWAKLAE